MDPRENYREIFRKKEERERNDSQTSAIETGDDTAVTRAPVSIDLKEKAEEEKQQILSAFPYLLKKIRQRWRSR